MPTLRTVVEVKELNYVPFIHISAIIGEGKMVKRKMSMSKLRSSHISVSPLMTRYRPRRDSLDPNLNAMMIDQLQGPRPLPPNLQQRPGMMNVQPSLPSSAGPVSEQLNRMADRMAAVMRENLESVFQGLSQLGSPEATIKGLQLELEKMKWLHQQELAQVKRSAEIFLTEMKTSMEQDKQSVIARVRRNAEIEKQKAVAETKRKVWCSVCPREAAFCCCGNTFYCDQQCRESHWPVHGQLCAHAETEQKLPPEPEPEKILSDNDIEQAESSVLGVHDGANLLLQFRYPKNNEER